MTHLLTPPLLLSTPPKPFSISLSKTIIHLLLSNPKPRRRHSTSTTKPYIWTPSASTSSPSSTSTLHSPSLPDLKSTINFLSSLGFSSLHIRGILNLYPEILSSPVSGLLPIPTFLLCEARVNDSDLKQVIHRRPCLCPTLYFLQFIDITQVHRHTYLLSRSVEDKLLPSVDYLKNVRFSRCNALAMFRRFPQLFCYSIEENLEPKFNYFVVEMGRDIKELNEFPHYFSFILEKRIRPRHQRCVEKGVCFPLPVLLKTNEVNFRERLEVCYNYSISLRSSPLWCTDAIFDEDYLDNEYITSVSKFLNG